MDEPPEIDYAAALLASVEAAGTKGLGRAKLLPAKPKATHGARAAALETLLRAGKVFNQSKTKAPKYVAAAFYQPPVNWHEVAYDRIQDLATPGVATIFERGDFEAVLKKGDANVPPVAKKELAKAIQTLLGEGQLLPVKFARKPAASKNPKAYYLHAASIAATPTQSATARSDESLSAQILAAYHELKQEQGFSDIAISELQARSAVPLPVLHDWLRTESRAGRAHPTLGDWSKAPPAERAAALVLGGQLQLRVKLV